jgi:choline monooxygenase
VLDYCFAATDSATTDPASAERNRLDVDASSRICEEDKAICEAVQRNLNAGAYGSGLLSPRHEAGIADFHHRVRIARDTRGA